MASIVKYHELQADTDGLVYFFPPSHKPDPLGDAMRLQGGPEAEKMLKSLARSKLQPRETTLCAAHGTKAALLVVTPAPEFDPVTHRGVDDYAAAIRACLNAANDHTLSSLTFGSWSLSSAGLPGRTAALISFQTLDEWTRANRRRHLKKIILAIHDREGLEIFRTVASHRKNSPLTLTPNITGEDGIWHVEKVLF